VIPTKSRRNPAKSEKLAGIRRNPVNLLLRRHVPGQICSSLTSLGPKKIRKKRREKKKQKPVRFCQIPVRFHRNHCSWFAIIIVEGILGKKNLEVPTLREIQTLRGYIVKIETSVDQIKNHHKLHRGNSYFSLRSLINN
jgi:hypothetical protein